MSDGRSTKSSCWPAQVHRIVRRRRQRPKSNAIAQHPLEVVAQMYRIDCVGHSRAPKVVALKPLELLDDGNVCDTNEELFGGLCYKKCSLLTTGEAPIRTSAWTCCASHPCTPFNEHGKVGFAKSWGSQSGWPLQRTHRRGGQVEVNSICGRGIDRPGPGQSTCVLQPELKPSLDGCPPCLDQTRPPPRAMGGRCGPPR